MHDAYEAIPIIEKLPLVIECITTCDDNLLIGTKQGHLLMYNILPLNKGDEKFEVQLARSNKYFSKRPILQLEAVTEYQILICLSDNVINIHDMTVFNFPLLFTLEKTRGAILFALDNQVKTTSSTGEENCILRMCVAVKRRLLFFYWKKRMFEDLSTEFCVPDVPRAIAWCSEAVCVGLKQEYYLIKLSGVQIGLLSTNPSSETNVIRLKSDRLALSKDNKTVFLDLEGNPIHKDWVTWSESLINLEYDAPYLVGVVSNQVEVRTINPRIQIQDIKLNKPKFIKACRSGGRLFVASCCNIWCLVLTPVSQQISQLIELKHFELALQLINLTNDGEDEKKRLEQYIQNKYAFDLFCKYKFDESLEMFLALETDASHVIGLFPDLLPKDYRNQLEYPGKLPELTGTHLENGLMALISYLTEVRHGLMKHLNKTSPEYAPLVEGSTTVISKTKLHQIIDTTLTNDALVGSLLRLPDNNCHVEETERALKQHQKYNDLITLYRCKAMHGKALELLQRQAVKEDSPLKGYDEIIKYLQHLGRNHLSLILRYAQWVLKEAPDRGLSIFADDIQEVETLPRDEVFKFLSAFDTSFLIPYLEYVITMYNDESTTFHNALVLQYLEKIVKSMAPNSGYVDNDEAPNSEMSALRIKFINLLNSSSFYVPESILVHFPINCLFEERAVVLGKLGRHEQALAIYSLVLQNIELAVEYCGKCYNKDNQDVYLTLFKMYICPAKHLLEGMPPEFVNSKPNLPIALQLLKDYSTKINPLKAIELLPNSLPLKELQRFLENVLEEKVATVRNCQVIKALSYAEQLQVHEQRIRYQSQKIIITDINTCSECKKRINVSAFIQYPNGEVVHFFCREKYQSRR
uniref:CNH domain-containing protein n=1 Tax=Strigamia maritima TaxID=126957 RepID=T1IQM8_STRMM